MILARFIDDKIAASDNREGISLSPTVPGLPYHHFSKFSPELPAGFSGIQASIGGQHTSPAKATPETTFIFRVELINRFPRALWEQAKTEFSF